MLVHPGSHTVNRTSRPCMLPLAMFVATLVLLALAIFLYAIIAEAASTSHPNFSGIWIFNPDESKLEVPQPTSLIFRIEQSESHAALVRTRTVGGETDTWQLAIATNGDEAIQQRGRMKLHYRMYWRDKTLVLQSIALADDYSATNVVEYSLSRNGRRLTAVERFEGPKLRYENKWVFDRR